jgi:tetratricopeptide (TPR) repeat protein
MYDESIEEFKAAIDLNPMDAKAHFYLGMAYRDRGLYEEAVKSFERSVQLNQSLWAGHEELGMIFYRKLKDKQKAVFHFEKLLSMKPDHPDADKIQDIINLLKKEP